MSVIQGSSKTIVIKDRTNVQIYKIVNGEEKGDSEPRFETLKGPTAEGPRETELAETSCWWGEETMSEYRKNFFSLRAVDDWNELQDIVKEARNVSATGATEKQWWRPREQ